MQLIIVMIMILIMIMLIRTTNTDIDTDTNTNTYYLACHADHRRPPGFGRMPSAGRIALGPQPDASQ